MNTFIALVTALLLSQTPAPQGDRFIDPVEGATAEMLVARGLEHFRAARAAEETPSRAASRVRPASLPAPSVEDGAATGERRFAADVRRRYVEAVAAALKLKAVTDSVDLARESHRVAHARAEQGRLPRRAADEMFVEVARMAAGRLAIEGEAEIALLALKHVVGLGPDARLRLRGEAGIDRPVPLEADGVERALAALSDVALRPYATLSIRHQVRAAYVRLDKARQAYALYRRDILEEALANAEVVRKAYELEGVSPLEYLAQEKSLADAEVGYADVWKAYMDAAIEVDVLVGR